MLFLHPFSKRLNRHFGQPSTAHSSPAYPNALFVRCDGGTVLDAPCSYDTELTPNDTMMELQQWPRHESAKLSVDLPPSLTARIQLEPCRLRTQGSTREAQCPTATVPGSFSWLRRSTPLPQPRRRRSSTRSTASAEPGFARVAMPAVRLIGRCGLSRSLLAPARRFPLRRPQLLVWSLAKDRTSPTGGSSDGPTSCAHRTGCRG